MKFDQFIQYRALNAKATIEGDNMSRVLDQFIDKAVASGDPDFKTVCAPLSVPMFDRLTNTLSLLQISKRTFIEAAILEALDRVDVIVREVDVFESRDTVEGEA